MSGAAAISGTIAFLFALVHLFAGRLRFLHVTPRSIWLSIAGGASVAYVFVHLLPELAEHQERLREGAIEQHIYVFSLAGLAAFYGLERLVRHPRKASETPTDDWTAPFFWLHVGAFALYNLLIGYLLAHREEQDHGGLAAYAIAMGLHFLVNDRGLAEHHGRAYQREARWLLAAAPLAGWALGMAFTLSDLALSSLFALLAGGVVLNVLKEELPEDRESRFWAFALGAGGYAGLLLAAG